MRTGQRRAANNDSEKGWMTMRYELLRLSMAHPGDVSELEKLLQSGSVRAEHIKGIIAQTEGDGYARGYSTLAFQVLLAPYLGWSHEEIFERIPMMMIGKTGCLMSPHYTLFIRQESAPVPQPADGKRFVF